MNRFIHLVILLWSVGTVSSFSLVSSLSLSARKATSLGIGKLFEEKGPLGKGITVGKVQVALSTTHRGRDSIFGFLGAEARSMSDDQYDLATFCRDTCLQLLRQKDAWVGAASESKWFGERDAGKAESTFNDWANKEAMKFEKEYISEQDSDKGGPTLAVVSIVVELAGDETEFDKAGFSFAKTTDILTNLASDVMVKDGECVNAVEIFWTPSDEEEVLTRNDILLDFPEIIDL